MPAVPLAVTSVAVDFESVPRPLASANDPGLPPTSGRPPSFEFSTQRPRGLDAQRGVAAVYREKRESCEGCKGCKFKLSFFSSVLQSLARLSL